MNPTLFHLGSIPIPTHEVFLGLGVPAAVLVLRHEARRRGACSRATNGGMR